MSLTALEKFITKTEERAKQLNEQERELLEQISTITSQSFTEQAAKELNSKTHTYSFRGYLELLQRLLTLLQEDMPEDIALEAVQTGLEAKEILEIWR
ncbi:MAG: hypothetical protein K2N51_01220 [Lachnospiraceae bacterium]|nr:hypothetical protein [Lachnospiraceae bacterium]